MVDTKNGSKNHHGKRRKTGATEEENTHIPTDLLEEILFRLPATDLQNFKSVCKDWLRLISSPQFIRKHLNISKESCNVTRILMPSLSAIIDYNHFANGSNISKEIPYPPGFSGENSMILGSCDGLICLLDKESKKLGLFNPSAGKSDIRILDGVYFKQIYFYWFGPDACTGEYVLVTGRICAGEVVIIDVYKFSSNLKCLQSCLIARLVTACWGTGTLLHGKLHWPARARYDDGDDISFRQIVSAYDFQKNKILTISAPRQSPFTLGVVHECLFAILKHLEMFELWIMKEYGVEQSWTKYRNIEGYDNCRVLSPLDFFRMVISS